MSHYEEAKKLIESGIKELEKSQRNTDYLKSILACVEGMKKELDSVEQVITLSTDEAQGLLGEIIEDKYRCERGEMDSWTFYYKHSEFPEDVMTDGPSSPREMVMRQLLNKDQR